VRTGRRDLLRDLNQTLVLNLVREHGPVSRADLARLAGLSPSTVTDITAQLVAEGWLLEDAQGSSGAVGRPATLLSVDPEAGHVVGIKLAADSLTAAVTNLTAEPLGVVRLAHLPEADAATVSELFESAVRRVVDAAGIDDGSLLGLGIGVPGMVAPGSTVVADSPLAAWTGVDLVETLETRLDLPVFLDNDVNTLTIAEQLYGAGRGLPHFVTVTVGRGIGMGAVVNGVVDRGARGGAGELGHVQVAEGPECWCGLHGCLEAVAAEPAIVRDVLAATDRLVSPDELATIAADDPRVRAIVERAGLLVGRAISTVATVLDPSRVIVSGEGVRLGDVYLHAIRAGFDEHRRPADPTELVIEPWGDEAWARGAATLVLRELFHPAHLRDEDAALARPGPASGILRRLALGGRGGRR